MPSHAGTAQEALNIARSTVHELNEFSKQYPIQMQLGPGDRNTQYLIGLKKERLFNRALKYYSRAIKKGGLPKEDLIAAYYERASLYMLNNESAKALKDISRLIELDPLHGLAYSLRGSIHEKLWHYDQAIADYSQAIEHAKPDTLPALLLKRAALYEYSSNFEKAISDHTQLIETMPNSGYAYARRGIAYYRITKYDQARADLERALMLEGGANGPAIDTTERPTYGAGTFAEACYLLGLIYEQENNHARALETYERGLRFQPDHYNLGIRTARLFLITETDLRDPVRALEIARHLAQLHPLEPAALYWLAAAEYQNTHYEEAIKAAKKALDRDPDSQELKDTLRRYVDGYRNALLKSQQE